MKREIITIPNTPICMMSLEYNLLTYPRERIQNSIKGVYARRFSEKLKKLVFLKRLRLVEKQEVLLKEGITRYIDILFIDNMKQLNDFIECLEITNKGFIYSLSDKISDKRLSKQEFLEHIKPLIES